jgi:hypothetical protein
MSDPTPNAVGRDADLPPKEHSAESHIEPTKTGEQRGGRGSAATLSLFGGKQDTLRAAQILFGLAAASLAILFLILFMSAYIRIPTPNFVNDTDTPLARFLIPNAIYLLISTIALLCVYIGYRLVRAAGATSLPVIPERDYNLLAPLIESGNANAIDQYVRLSSLSKFTGTFTQLGLTGLPLATIALTLFFSIVALFHPDGFLDLTKLTLGAFIGSFVQRQVERRAEDTQGNPSELSEAKTPPGSA